MANEHNDHAEYVQATHMTAMNLSKTITTLPHGTLSELELPEIERISNEVARIVPAGNVPGLILSGLALLEGRRIKREESEKHINLLFKGVRMTLDRAVFGTFFAGPAAILYGYQQLLRLAGKDVNDAFPNGTWQFYLEFALRDDSARHTVETDGFHRYCSQTLDEPDRLAAWMLASAHFVHSLPRMLENEWRERILLKTLAEILAKQTAGRREDPIELAKTIHRDIYGRWERQRPYHRTETEDHPTTRRLVFDAYWMPIAGKLRNSNRQEFEDRLEDQTLQRLALYQKQMSWLAYLTPDEHHEKHVHYTFEDAQIGVIHRDRYYLVPLAHVLDEENARRVSAAILSDQSRTPRATIDDALVTMPRPAQVQIRKNFDEKTQTEVELLQRTPILINWDVQDGHQRLSVIRQGKRGIGDHALTIFNTTRSTVFDQSHIFFDGAWGASVAQVMTNDALFWANTLSTQSPLDKAFKALPAEINRLRLQAKPEVVAQGEKQRIKIETSAENTSIKMRSILSLRELLKQRNDLAQITVNDLFILYRSIHAHLYQPSPELLEEVETLASQRDAASKQAYTSVVLVLDTVMQTNPAILIPIDASRYDPRERVFPTTFRNPLNDFVYYHRHALEALEAYEGAEGHEQATAIETFRHAQAEYLRLIGGFGQLLSRYKEIALAGESTSITSIKFLAHLPDAFKALLNTIPNRFDLLNEIIKGEEVFSNTGRVAVGSTLRRFMTAKDDNDQKTLSWGVQTDDENVAHLSLRDFRPHVQDLHKIGRDDLAQKITQDYLDAYARGLNTYIEELRKITIGIPRASARRLWFRR